MPTFQEKGVTAYKPGLERIAAFCRHLGNPQRNYFTIHVAGTNGKGSVSHIIAAVLQQENAPFALCRVLIKIFVVFSAKI